ncbi:MAG: amidophosphoribosyltransferase [Holophagaceae bacterium]|nr:amidophosphoribosyltransferase [Acidobacteriota bacterium]
MGFKDECGVFGITQHSEAANLTYLGLYALQHRGQEAAGICATDGTTLRLYKDQGYVADIFHEDNLKLLTGKQAIGHTRYSTTGGNIKESAQPFIREGRFGRVALCHNGNLTNAEQLRTRLLAEGITFQSPSDSEVLLALIQLSKSVSLSGAIVEALKQVEGAYSLLIMDQENLFAIRDPHGFRPLVLGKLGPSFIFSSESCAFDLIAATYDREVDPGELIQIHQGVLQNSFPFEKRDAKPCVFEHVYFSRPDSFVFGQSVMKARREMGRLLAQRHPVNADLVIPVPDSGVPAALGFAETSGIAMDFGLIRNHYVGRTFIEPKQSIRSFGVRIKLNPVRHLIEDKRVVLIDDSIVRGTTSKKIVEMVRQAGAREVHFRVSSPPTTHSCFYGIDTPSRENLIASHMNNEAMNQFIGSDTLAFLTLKDLSQAVQDQAEGMGYCYACFNGDYAVPPPL